MVLDLGGRVNDGIVLALTLLMGGLLMLSGPAAYWDWSWVKQQSVGREIVGTVLCTAMGLFFLWIAALRACRLFSAAPDALIDASGVTLQPCMARKTLGWAQITGSRVKRDWWRGMPIWTLELDLAEPQQVLASAFLPTRTVKLASNVAGPVKKAARIVRHYRTLAGHPQADGGEGL